MFQSKLFKTQDIRDKIVLVTGASAGIGKAAAYGYAEQGCHLILVARRVDRLEELKTELQNDYKVKVHIQQLDISQVDKIKELPEQLPEEFQKVDILINNAGMGLGGGSIDFLNIEEASLTFDVNVKGVLALMRIFMPGMQERKYGHVINITSRAAELYMDGGATYFSTKYAVKAITECARRDVVNSPIRITEIRPGLVETEFFDVAFKGKNDGSIYNRYQCLDSMDVAAACVYASTRPHHVQINVMTLQPTNQDYGGGVFSNKK